MSTFDSQVSKREIIETQKLISLHNNGEDEKRAHVYILQISSCWEHISTWNMHELFSKGTTVFQMNFQGKIFFTQNWCNITLTFRALLPVHDRSINVSGEM